MRTFKLIVFLNCFLFCSKTIFANQGFLGGVKISDRGLERLTDEYLNDFGLTFLEDTLTALTIPDVVIGSVPERCQTAHVTSMTLSQAWSTCVGLPEYFFEDSDPIRPLMPRPLMIDLRKVKIKTLKIHHTKSECASELCEVAFFISELDLGFDLTLKEFTKQRVVFSGEGLRLYYEPETPDTDLLELKFKVDFRFGRRQHKFLDFPNNKDESLVLPQGARFSLQIGEQKSPINLSEQVISKYEQQIKQFQNPRNHQDFLTAATHINRDVLKDPFIRHQLNALLVTHLVPEIIKETNIYFDDLIKKDNKVLSIGALSVQNFADEERNHKGFVAIKIVVNDLHSFVQGAGSNVDMKKIMQRKGLDQVEEFIQNFLKSVRRSSSETDQKTLQDIANLLIKLYEAFLNLKVKIDQSEGDFKDKYMHYVSHGQKRVQALFKEVQSEREQITQRIQTQTLKIPFSLGLQSPYFYPFSLMAQVRSPFGDFHSQSGDWGNDEHLDFDIGVRFSVEGLNRIIEDIYKRQGFDFDLYDDDVAAFSSNKRVSITLEESPKIEWDDTKKRYLISLPDVFSRTKVIGPFKSSDTTKFQLYISPEIQNGKLILNPELDGSTRLISPHNPITSAINFFKTVSIIHPLVANWLLDSVVSPEGEKQLAHSLSCPSIPISKRVELSPKIVHVESSPQDMKLYFKIQRTMQTCE